MYPVIKHAVLTALSECIIQKLLIHNGEYWFAKLSWGKNFFISLDFWNLIIHKSNSSSDFFLLFEQWQYTEHAL